VKTNCLVVIIFISIVESCATWKGGLVANGNQNDAVKNAVLDFLQHNRLIRNDSVFSIIIRNVSQNVFAVGILPEINKIPVITKNEIDYSYKAFPTNFIEEKGKLFYWKDSTQEESAELIDKLAKMNRIDTAIFGRYLGERHINDSQKEMDYYFCKSDLKKYKKVYSSIAIGWYDPPVLECARK
jgi:hypothetical protein